MGMDKTFQNIAFFPFGGLLPSKQDAPPSASDIQQEAQQKSQMRARKRAQDVERGGKTIFTSPTGIAGLKPKLGM